MKVNLKLVLAASLITLAVVPAQAQQSCQRLEETLSSCQAELQDRNNQVQSLSSHVQGLRGEIQTLVQLRDRDLPNCDRNLNRTRQESRELHRVTGEVQGEFNRVAQSREQAARQLERIERDRFLKWECAVKDRKYGGTGMGEGATRQDAVSRAIDDGGIRDMVRKHGSYELCFKVFR